MLYLCGADKSSTWLPYNALRLMIAVTSTWLIRCRVVRRIQQVGRIA